nr:hypothetical protein [Tanacetum cinerariifolium]
ILDKCKTGLGYNAVPPPYTRNFMPLKPDFSSLEEFVNDPIVSKPTVKKPIVETSESKARADKPKVVRKNFGSPLIKDWILDSEDENESKPKIEKKTVKPSFAKIEFVKSKEQVKSPRKTTIKHEKSIQYLHDKGVINSGCSRHMTGNMSYLIDYEEIDGRYVAFRGNRKGGKITGRAERRNKTLIEAARTMLADSKLTTTFWAEAVDTACYVQNRVSPVTILNTKDHLSKFNGKADEGLFIRHSLNSKSFGGFNNRTRILEENLHIRYKGCVDAGISDDEKKVDEDPRQESKCKDQEKEDNVKSTNNVNAASIKRVNVVGTNTNNELPFDLKMFDLEDISTFNFSSDHKDDDEEADMNNMDTPIQDPDFSDKVYKVEKALYRLHQALRAWYDTLSTYLLDNRFHRGKIDKTLFIRMHKDYILLVQVYVDHIIFGLTKKELYNAFENMMHEMFQMSSIGELTFFLALQVKQKQDGIFLSQDKYIDEILKKYGFLEVKNASTPMETQNPLLKDEDGEEVDVHMYRSMIGSLMYLTSLRPDIMFAAYACVRYQVNPKVLHLHAVKRIFRYLNSQPKFGLWYPKDSPFDLVAYTDSDYAGASLDRKSTTGGCQFLRCRLIS